MAQRELIIFCKRLIQTSYSSHFEILDFDREKQFVNPTWKKLKQLATQTEGAVYFPDQVNTLIKSLLEMIAIKQ
jgi:hypothetical protein